MARDRESALEGRRVLIVEDDVRNVFALSRVLEPKGLKVEIARNGREALDHLAAKPGVDLVLMDVMMPGDRWTASRRRARFASAWASRTCPSSRSRPRPWRTTASSAWHAGANDYIAKPLDVDKLLSLARVWMPKSTATADADADIDRLLSSAFHRYHYDFRGYAAASLKRRITAAVIHFGCGSVAALEARMLADARTFSELLRFLTVQVSEPFPAIRPTSAPSARRSCRTSRRTRRAQGLGRGLRDGRGGILARHPPRGGGAARPHAHLCDGHQPRVAARGGAGHLRRRGTGRASATTIASRAAAPRCPTTTRRATTPPSSTARSSGRSCSPDHSLATDSVFAEVQLVSRAATCSSISTARSRTAPSKASCSDSLCRRGFLGLGSRESLRFSAHAAAFRDIVPSERLYQRI